MDPDANLREQRELAAEIIRINDAADADGLMSASEQADINDAAVRLAELVQALDEWISKGGALPAPWQQAKQSRWAMIDSAKRNGYIG